MPLRGPAALKDARMRRRLRPTVSRTRLTLFLLRLWIAQSIPDAVLQKPGKLTKEEFELMKKHPEYGWAVLRQIPGMERASLMVLHHHENVDGTGYPGGLKDEEIPLGSRIVSAIDAFDAMVSSRPYRAGLPFEEAERRLLQASGTQFDSGVVQNFLPLARAEMVAVFAAAGTTVAAAL